LILWAKTRLRNLETRKVLPFYFWQPRRTRRAERFNWTTAIAYNASIPILRALGALKNG